MGALSAHPPLPAGVAGIVVDVFGERGRRWIAELPRMIDERCAAWGLDITAAPLSGGTHSYVVPVRRADGGPAILKLPVQDEENLAEATALWHYDGDGAVRLYGHDPASGAILMEHAAPGDPLVRQDDTPFEAPHSEGHPDNVDKIERACALYRRLWRSPASHPRGYPEFPRVADLLVVWRKRLPSQAEAVGDPRLVERAIGLCEEYSTPDGPEGVVNRDTHLGNIVSAAREPWLLIDPKPLWGERAFDAGFLLLIQAESVGDPETVEAMVERTARGLGVDPERARGWAFLRAMEEISWGAEDGRAAVVDRHRRTATLLAPR